MDGDDCDGTGFGRDGVNMGSWMAKGPSDLSVGVAKLR